MCKRVHDKYKHGQSVLDNVQVIGIIELIAKMH